MLEKFMFEVCVTISAPQHRRRASNNDNSRKGMSFKYFLMLRSNITAQRIHVCKVMFMRTLAIGQRQLRDWLTETSFVVTDPVPAPAPLQPGNDDSEEVNSIVELFDKLPKVESHYCRCSTVSSSVEEHVQAGPSSRVDWWIVMTSLLYLP